MSENQWAPQMGEDGVMDFTIPRKRMQFRVDRDVFEAAPAIPAEILMRLQGMADQVNDLDKATEERRREFLRGFFGQFLLQESLERFLSRLADLGNPIDIIQMSKIMEWAFQEYSGGLPFGQLEASSGGQQPNQGDGTNSMATASSTVSTSDGSQPPVPSTSSTA